MFEEHGTFRITIETPLLVIDTFEHWNDTTMEQYTRQLNAALSQLPAHWVALARVHGLPILSPDAEAILVTSLRLRGERRQLATAYVIDYVAGLPIAIAQLRRIYGTMSMPIEFFSTELEARDWLLKRLAQ